MWAQIEPEPGDTATMFGAMTFAPAACGLDAEGLVWAANALDGPLSRIAPGGQIVDQIPIRRVWPSSPAASAERTAATLTDRNAH